MTRKCALCKETNYKNNYSFFSAPKDPEIRKKWQIALAIENYAVVDDTYVCSKHFHKNDIITHWVSGAPPQEIKIKYKKCRLRPGAVPSRNLHSVNSSQSTNKNNLNKCNINLKESRIPVEGQWEHDVTSTDSYLKVDSINSLKTIDDWYIDNSVLTTLNNDDPDAESKPAYADVNKNEILFEDFLEVCTEISVPRGWSCLVTSKGYGTTVVYLYMSITTDGLPFVEKQVFLRRDMMLHCVVINREIDSLMHNLVTEDKHIKVRRLLDMEKLIDEFDRRVVCQGICDSKCYEDISMKKVAYNDGIKWRHTSCPLIVNSDASRCTNCTMSSHTLIRKSRKSLPFNYDSTTITREKRKAKLTKKLKTYKRARLSIRAQKRLENY